MGRSIEELLQEAARYKEEGNELFASGQYKKAISKYSTVFAFTRGLPGSKRGMDNIASMAVGTPIDPSLDQRAVELERLSELNIAACYLKLERGKEALEHSNKAIELDATVGKAFLRKGQALLLLKNYDGCQTKLSCYSLI